MYLLIGVDWVGFQSLTSNIYGCSVCYMGVTMAKLVDSGVGVAGGKVFSV